MLHLAGAVSAPQAPLHYPGRRAASGAVSLGGPERQVAYGVYGVPGPKCELKSSTCVIFVNRRISAAVSGIFAYHERGF